MPSSRCGGVDAEEAGLLGGELEHPLRGLVVAVAGLLVAARVKITAQYGGSGGAAIGPFWPRGVTGPLRLPAAISDM